MEPLRFAEPAFLWGVECVRQTVSHFAPPSNAPRFTRRPIHGGSPNRHPPFFYFGRRREGAVFMSGNVI